MNTVPFTYDTTASHFASYIKLTLCETDGARGSAISAKCILG